MWHYNRNIKGKWKIIISNFHEIVTINKYTLITKFALFILSICWNEKLFEQINIFFLTHQIQNIEIQ